MKKLILSSLSLLAFSCVNPQPKGESTTSRYGDYSLKVIDSCEYIEYDYGIVDQRVYSLTHKGNCKFCAKKFKENIFKSKHRRSNNN